MKTTKLEYKIWEKLMSKKNALKFKSISALITTMTKVIDKNKLWGEVYAKSKNKI